MTRQSFVKGAVILTLAGFSVRFVGAFFRIALAALIGEEGVGIFQMAYPVYGILLAISTAGIPIAISKLVAENLARGNYRGAYKIFRISLFLLAVSGLTISAVLYFCAEFFAMTVAQEPRAYLPLVTISPAIFLVTVMSAYRGFFQGQQQMMPTALSQIVEQIGRVGIALLLVLLLVPRGLEYAAAGASFGAAAGALFGLILLMLIWFRQKKQFMAGLDRQRVEDSQTFREIVYHIFALSAPISLGSVVMPLISIVDLSVVPHRLHAAGLAERATALFGQLTGMAGPIIHIPTIITVALAISLVPAISESLALGRMRLVRERSYFAVRMTMMLSLPSALGLYLLAEPITVLLYNNAEAGAVLAAMSLAVVFLTLYQTTSAILQGLGRTMDPVVSLFWGALVKTVLTWWLTALPALHIRGAAMATVVGFGVASLLNMYRVGTLTGMQLRPVHTLLKPIMASAGMGVAVLFVYERMAALHTVFSPSLTNKAATLTAISAGALAYVLLLFILGGIERDDLTMLPKVGQPLLRLADKLHLLKR